MRALCTIASIMLLLGILARSDQSLAAEGKPVGYVAPNIKGAMAIEAEVRAMAYSLLCTQAKARYPKMDRARAIIEKKHPDFFSTPGMAETFLTAALTGRLAKMRRLVTQVKAARALLKKQKRLSSLKDKRFRRAVLYLDKASIGSRFISENKETLEFTRTLRLSAYSRACSASMKCIAAAIEMHCLDNNSSWPSGKVDQASLKKNGYLQSPVKCLTSGKASYEVDAKGKVRCRHHGSIAKAMAGVAHGYTGADLKRLYFKNSVFRALDGVLKRKSPDGKGLIRIK